MTDLAELQPDALESGVPMDGYVEVTLAIQRAKLEKLNAWMNADHYEEAQRVRRASLEKCLDSLRYLVKEVLAHPSGGTARIAQFLASLYNGDRVKADGCHRCRTRCPTSQWR